jgi:hypothetical protein
MSEEVIGTHTGKSYNIIGKQHRTYQCANCRKQVHCIAGYENDGDPVELLKDRCGKDCECKCKTHYLGKDGKLKKYGTVDVSTALDDFEKERPRNETDDFIDELNKEFNESKLT